MPKEIIVHHLDHAISALKVVETLQLSVDIASPPAAIQYAGANYFHHIFCIAQRTHPQVKMRWILDCGDNAGFAMSALRHGVKCIRFTGPVEIFEKLAEMAAQLQATIINTYPPQVLDLLNESNVEKICSDWLSRAA